MRIENSVTVNRPVETVFAAMTDVERTPKWSATVQREWWKTDPPIRVGSVRHSEGVILGQPFENDATVSEYDPPHRAVLRGDVGGMPLGIGFTFDPVPGGTRITVIAEFEPRGALRFAAPMIRNEYRKIWNRDLATFKRMIEAGQLSGS